MCEASSAATSAAKLLQRLQSQGDLPPLWPPRPPLCQAAGCVLLAGVAITPKGPGGGVSSQGCRVPPPSYLGDKTPRPHAVLQHIWTILNWVTTGVKENIGLWNSSFVKIYCVTKRCYLCQPALEKSSLRRRPKLCYDLYRSTKRNTPKLNSDSIGAQGFLWCVPQQTFRVIISPTSYLHFFLPSLYYLLKLVKFVYSFDYFCDLQNIVNRAGGSEFL